MANESCDPTPAPSEAVKPGTRMVHCVKFDKDLPGLDRIPWRGEIGANLSSPWNAIQPGQIFVKFHTVHHARAGFHRFTGCRCWITRFVRHALLLTRVLPTYLTATFPKFLVAGSLSTSVRAIPVFSEKRRVKPEGNILKYLIQ